MPLLTSEHMLRLITAAERSVDKAGTGTMRGLILIRSLADMGVNFYISEVPPSDEEPRRVGLHLHNPEAPAA